MVLGPVAGAVHAGAWLGQAVRALSTAQAALHGAGKAGAAASAAGTGATQQKKLGLAQVQHIVAVSSAKGGVGKSTTAVNLAVALATALQLRVGLLDADIHGPSIGKMMNLKGKPAVTQGGQPLLVPRENHRVKTMSMGYFMEGDEPAVWRGPMVSSAFDKMAIGTDWGALDVLVVDMPPGTGDAQINLAQRIPLSGALIVSTPQDVALLDARRGAQLFRKTRVPVLGLVENMSWHQCSSCGHKEAIFGEGGVQRMAQDFGLEVLGQVPLDIAVRVRSDSGVPVVIGEPNHPCSKVFISMASKLWETLKSMEQGSPGAPAGPKIVME